MAATHTTNLGLNKPARGDFVSVVNDINDNMDTIDTKIGDLGDDTVAERIIGTETKIGNTALPTTAQTLTGAIAEHEEDLHGTGGIDDQLSAQSAEISAICQTITGATNNTGHTINSGEYFIANGGKYLATASIPNGQTWSDNSTAVSDNDIINALNSKCVLVGSPFTVSASAQSSGIYYKDITNMNALRPTTLNGKTIFGYQFSEGISAKIAPICIAGHDRLYYYANGDFPSGLDIAIYPLYK